MKEEFHTPVLLKEAIENLQPGKNESFIDGTVGQGGHALEIMKRILPGGRLLAIDRDIRNLETVKARLHEYASNITFIHDSFANTKSHAYVHGFTAVDGILLDLGFSSAHIQEPGRGFSFMDHGPLDMRYDTRGTLTAAHIINEWSKEELEKIFRVYGEERQAKRLAQTIVGIRKLKAFETTTQLAEAIERIVSRHGKLHPATKVFQALRIAVNDELGQIERALPDLVDLLKPRGRIAIISFHSLEDRLIKQFFKNENGKRLHVLTKKVIQPTREEIKINPKSRSAKLRVAQRL